ncbi:MAG: hypothetical protein ABSG96_12640 [Terracidiphilus sp.]|jgi:hypothetical protein
MKRISAMALFTIATLVAATGLLAQQPALKADIPFNFTVGDTSMPAGEYTITSIDSRMVKIQSVDKQHVGWVAALQSHQESESGAQLVFDRYGEFYFLHRILSPTATSLNLNVASGKIEKSVRTREAQLRTGEPTLVAAR